jgi:hypothetical protein
MAVVFAIIIQFLLLREKLTDSIHIFRLWQREAGYENVKLFILVWPLLTVPENKHRVIDICVCVCDWHRVRETELCVEH